MMNNPSSFRAVSIETLESSEIIKSESTSFPLTIPAIVAFAKPGPISFAISINETGESNFRFEESGRVIKGINCSLSQW